ncbi:hypothetical protein [Rubrivirga sp. IMCC45206]
MDVSPVDVRVYPVAGLVCTVVVDILAVAALSRPVTVRVRQAAVFL